MPTQSQQKNSLRRLIDQSELDDSLDDHDKNYDKTVEKIANQQQKSKTDEELKAQRSENSLYSNLMKDVHSELGGDPIPTSKPKEEEEIPLVKEFQGNQEDPDKAIKELASKIKLDDADQKALDDAKKLSDCKKMVDNDMVSTSQDEPEDYDLVELSAENQVQVNS